jgi:hypothetical protein
MKPSNPQETNNSPKKTSVVVPTAHRKRSLTDGGILHLNDTLKDQLKQVNDTLLAVEIIFKETHTPKDIDERQPLQKALNETLQILASLQIKEYEQTKTLQVGNKFSARLQSMNRGPSDQNIVTSYRLATSSTLCDIKLHLNAIQTLIAKDERPLNINTCVNKLKEVHNILQEGLNQFYAHRRVVFKLHRSLYVKVAEAKDLPAMDLRGTSDPYVEIFVDNEKKARTRTIRKTLEPCWLQEFDILLKPESKEVCFKVFDEDLKKNDFIGQVLIDIDSLKDGATYEQWLNLMPKANRTEGSIHLILKYIPNATENFIVQVLRGTKLAPDKGPIDAMCKVMIIEPGKGKTNIFKTDVLKKTENPVWSATFKMTLETDQLASNSLLVVRVYDNAKYGFLGQVSIPLSNFIADVGAESYCSQWFHLYPKPPKNEKKLGTIRLQLRYQEERILPDECYERLFELLNTKDLEIIMLMHKFVPNTAEKKILFSSVVAAFEGKGKAVHLIDTLTSLEMEQITNPEVLFRANTLGSICLDAYQKLVCSHLLEGDFLKTIKEIMKTKKVYELDPLKTKAGAHEIKKNMQFILEKVKQIWQHIQNTANEIPTSLREIYSRLQLKAKVRFPNSQARYAVVTGFIFLRFFCAATLSPHLFHVVDEIPDEHATRNLTLVSKILMSLANFRTFEAKESYLQPANDFINENIPKVKQYIDSIASVRSNLSLQFMYF